MKSRARESKGRNISQRVKSIYRAFIKRYQISTNETEKHDALVQRARS